MSKKSLVLSAASACLLCTSLVSAPIAMAGGTIKLDNDKWINIGAGLRPSFTSQDDAAPNGTDDSNDFELESIRLYINGQVHKNIGFTFNTERYNDPDPTITTDKDEIRVLDGIIQFAFDPAFNVWFGRMLPPSDRSNLSGPYYLGTWDFPSEVQMYPSIFAGRDDGISFWGEFGGGKFKYQAGLFEGTERDDPLTNPNQEDEMLLAARFTLNLLDPEPGYYNSSTYFGKKEILAIGAAYMSQKDGAGDATVANGVGDYRAYSVDVLFEKRLGGTGTLTAEGALYKYDLDDKYVDADLIQGEGYFALVGFLLPFEVGPGKFQPHVRRQFFEDDDPAAGVDEVERVDIGVTYVIDGHNARLTVILADVDEDGPAAADYDLVKFGAQIQF